MSGDKGAVKRDGGWWVPVGLVLLTLVLAWLSPSEKTLGDQIKLVFLHGALTWVGMLLYTIAGLTGLIYLGTRAESWYQWARAFYRTALLTWGAVIGMGYISMTVIWGGFQGEPRFIMMIGFWVLAWAIYYLAGVLETPRAAAALYAAAAIVLWTARISTGRLFHPQNPIGESNLTAIKVVFAAILMVMLLAGLDVVRRVRRGR
ncbi:MAG: hypothetical protein M1598_06835 [Actinobacteria bacterium]|nr:hypothetical protein [Actinomycetota bacterium]